MEAGTAGRTGRKKGVFPNSPKAMPCFAAPERGETHQVMHKPQTYAARSAIKFFWFLFFQEKERPPGEGKQRHNWEHAEKRSARASVLPAQIIKPFCRATCALT